ncbi:pseudouridine synthase [Bacteroidota bacterium]
MELVILYQDDWLVAVNKPHDLLVHRTKIANTDTEFTLQILRNQIGQKVYPVHRLDRKTGGVLLFALDADTNSKTQQMFMNNAIHKKYLAIVRGYTDDQGHIDYPVKKENGKVQDAVTSYKTIGQTELNMPFGKHKTSRYSLVEIIPETGRIHQIRKHFAHILHPIIADRPYGCNKQNKFFKEQWNMTTMLLHAWTLELIHPVTNMHVKITATIHGEFRRMIDLLGFGI